MKLPNPERAIVNIAKLRGYCLSVEHRRGQHKARVFATALGITTEHAEELQTALLNAAQTYEATPTEHDTYGQRYVLDFTLARQGRQATIRSSWIIRRGEDFPRLTSCYVL
jgi:hemerythrin-like domain-containing protein